MASCVTYCLLWQSVQGRIQDLKLGVAQMDWKIWKMGWGLKSMGLLWIYFKPKIILIHIFQIQCTSNTIFLLQYCIFFITIVYILLSPLIQYCFKKSYLKNCPLPKSALAMIPLIDVNVPLSKENVHGLSACIKHPCHIQYFMLSIFPTTKYPKCNYHVFFVTHLASWNFAVLVSCETHTHTHAHTHFGK